MKQPPYLALLQDFNKAIVAIQTCWRFPLLVPLKYIYLIMTASKSHSHIRVHSKQLLERRIRSKEIEHVDFLERIIPENHEPPTDPKEWRHFEQIAGQILVAGFEPPAVWFYFTIYHLSNDESILRHVTSEVRKAFADYRDITSAAAAELPYLTACLKESLRMVPAVPNGMPCYSPGISVDGEYIPRGVRNIQTDLRVSNAC